MENIWSKLQNRLLEASNVGELDNVFAEANDEIMRNPEIENDEDGQARFVAFYEKLRLSFTSR